MNNILANIIGEVIYGSGPAPVPPDTFPCTITRGQTYTVTDDVITGCEVILVETSQIEASFSGPTGANLNQTVTFTDTTDRSVSSREWTFEGGTPATGSSSPISVSYGATGSFDVTLSVTDITGTDTLTKTDYITIEEGFGPDSISGLYTWWDFNDPVSYTDGASTVNDLTANGNDGVVGANITSALDGSVRYIVGNDTGGNDNAVSLVKNVTTDLAAATFLIVVKKSVDSQQVWLRGYNDDSNSFIAQNGTGDFYYQNVGTPTAYQNGSLDASVIQSVDGWKLRSWSGLNLSDSRFGSGFQLGGYQSSWEFDGQVVALMMYDRALSQAEITQIYQYYDAIIDLDT